MDEEASLLFGLFPRSSPFSPTHHSSGILQPTLIYRWLSLTFLAFFVHQSDKYIDQAHKDLSAQYSKSARLVCGREFSLAQGTLGSTVSDEAPTCPTLSIS